MKLEDRGSDELFPYELINEFTQFELELKINLRKSELNEKEVIDATNVLMRLQTHLDTKLASLNDIIFDCKKFDFVKSTKSLEENIIGTIEHQPKINCSIQRSISGANISLQCTI